MAKRNSKRPVRSSKKKQKFKIPPGFIIGGIFFLIVMIIAAAIINLKVDVLKVEVKNKKKEENILKDYANIEDTIKLILFDNELDKAHFKKDINKGIPIYKVEIPEEKIYSIKSSLISAMTKKGYKEQENLTFKNESIAFKIVIIPYETKRYKPEITLPEKEPAFKVSKKKKIALILDDAGYNIELAKEIASLPYNITLSIIPFTEHDGETAKLLKKHNKEVFLHLPMEPKSYPETDPGKGAIFRNTPETLLKIIIDEDFQRIGKIDGVNNHMGSAFTEDAAKLRQMFKYLKNYTSTFIDSRTSKDSVAYDICKEYFSKCGINNIFIDNLDSHEYIKEKIDKGISLLEKQDTVIMIGHLRPTTVNVLKSYLPEIEKRGITFSTVNEVLSN
jgi:hypothetical protein